jgi:hypothetical protein
VEDDAPGRAVDGTEFTTWSSSVPVTGEIFLQARGGRTTWGRPFPLRPAFAEGVEAALLGRSDFFNAFSVHFTTRRSTAVMYIDTGLRARVSGIPWSLVPEPAMRALLRRRRR